MKPIILVLLLIHTLALSLSANASDHSSSTNDNSSTNSYGNDTKVWINLQSSGEVASPRKQTLTGPEMKVIHKKYIESLSYPSPDLAIENVKTSR